MSQPLRLKGGTVAIVNGVEVVLHGEADVDVPNESFEMVRPFSTTPLIEYPKSITLGETTVVAQSADHEAELRAASAPPPPPVAERANPLDDIDLDGAADEPPSRKGGKKK